MRGNVEMMFLVLEYLNFRRLLEKFVKKGMIVGVVKLKEGWEL